MQTRILIAQSDHGMADMLSTSMADAGFDVAVSPDGCDAIARCEKERFDVVLADVAMEKSNGIQILKDIRKIDPFAPSVILLGSLGRVSVVEATKLGAEAVFPKPFAIVRLIDAVKNCVPRAPQPLRETASSLYLADGDDRDFLTMRRPPARVIVTQRVVLGVRRGLSISQFLARTVNLSTQGLQVVAFQLKASPLQPVDLTFSIGGIVEGISRTFEIGARARVQWARKETNDTTRLGLEFDQLEERQAQTLMLAVNQLKTGEFCESPDPLEFFF